MLYRFQFNRVYFISTIVLLVVEIAIALFAHDRFIRPFVGDVLVVILIYCFVKSFYNSPVFLTAIAVLAFSFLLETLQYFHIVKMLGLQHSKIASIIIGTSFEWSDLLAYTIGIIIVLLSEKYFGQR